MPYLRAKFGFGRWRDELVVSSARTRLEGSSCQRGEKCREIDQWSNVRTDLGKITLVLQVCVCCGELRTRELPGIWSFEDLQRSQTDREIAKTLGVKLP